MCCTCAPQIQMNDKDITNEKNRDSKTEITIHDGPSNKRKDSVHVEEWYIMKQATVLLSGIKSRINIFVITGMI